MAESPSPNPRIYVAGPLGFFESGRRYHQEILLPELATHGLMPLDPWDPPDDLKGRMLNALALDSVEARTRHLREVNTRLGARNEHLIRAAGGVLAILDGPDVDSGTAAEIGFAYSLGLPIVGVYTDLRSGGDNTAAPVNLQVLYFIEASGGGLVRDLPTAIERLRAVVRVSE